MTREIEGNGNQYANIYLLSFEVAQTRFITFAIVTLNSSHIEKVLSLGINNVLIYSCVQSRS